MLERLLDEQRLNNEWASFVESTELILKFGLINKRKKGLFTRRRMLLLTNKPRLIYIDPASKVKKGEIPFDKHLKTEPKNFQMFLLHTVSHPSVFIKNLFMTFCFQPNRIYYLEDTQSQGRMWCEAIDSAKEKYLQSS